MTNCSILIHLTIGLMLSFLLGCGERKRTSSNPGPRKTAIEQLFDKEGTANGIPPKLMLAAAWYESRLVPTPSKIPYINTQLAEGKLFLGFDIAETAFGISNSRLGLDTNEPTSLETQVAAYASWLAGEVEELDLPARPSTPTDTYLWIWEMAKRHRQGGNSLDSRNNQILWARSLLEVLNTEHTWRDPLNDETLIMAAANPKLKPESLEEEARLLSLDLKPSREVYEIDYFRLNGRETGEAHTPTRLEVIHCPFNLSACIEIQGAQSLDSQAQLEAHFLIPAHPSETTIRNPIQVVNPKVARRLTQKDGEPMPRLGSMVIMLVGRSGRFDSQGYRADANPVWYTPWQLTKLGEVARSLCSVMHEDPLDQSDCRDPGHPNGVKFYARGSGESYRWGQIPDFDENIFGAYVRDSRTEIDGRAAFVFSKRSKRFVAKKPIRFKVRVPITARRIEIERAVRCQDGNKIVWDRIETESVQNVLVESFSFTIADGGPNKDGHYFLRAQVFNKSDELIAWVTDDLFISDFDPEVEAGARKSCSRFGT